MNVRDLLEELAGRDPDLEVVIVTETDEDILKESGEFEDFSPMDVANALDGHIWQPHEDTPVRVQYGQLQIAVLWPDE